MNSLVVFFALFACALSAPVEDALVEVRQDTHGNYKLFYKTKESVRTEEGRADGTVSGSISYIDDQGHQQSLTYTSGRDGYHAISDSIPVSVKVLPEVAQAHAEHAQIFHAIESSLPPLKPDGTVDELPEHPLSKEEFLSAVANILHGDKLKFLEDTPEVSYAKAEHFKAQADAFPQ